jgi:hypothetical protein
MTNQLLLCDYRAAETCHEHQKLCGIKVTKKRGRKDEETNYKPKKASIRQKELS